MLNRCPQELHLPRTVFSFFHDRDVIRVVESNLFIELMMDAYAFVGYIELPDSAFRFYENYKADTRQGVAVEYLSKQPA